MKLSNNLLAAAFCLIAATAYAGPYDVLHDPHSEPVGQLKPEHILQPEAPEEDPVPAAPPPPVEEVQIQNPSGIDVQEAAEVDLVEQIGLLNGAQGAGDQVWQYLTIEEARQLLRGLPTPMKAGGLRDAVVKLLITEAAAPRGEARGWLMDRTEALIRIGAVNEASLLIERMPEEGNEPPQVKLYALAMMLAGKTGQACDRAARYESTDATMTDSLRRLVMFCQAHEGRFEEVELAINLRREGKDPMPSWFASLIEAMQYPGTRLRAMPASPHPLDVAMILSAVPAHLPKGISLTDFAKQSSYFPYYALLGDAQGAAAADRLMFIEASVEAGALYSRKEIEALYRLTQTEGAPVASSLQTRVRNYFKLVDAPNTKTALRDMYEAIKAFGFSYELAERMLTSPLSVLSQTMRPEQPYLAYAPQAYAILLSAGKLDDTGKWLRMMDVHRESSATTYVAHELARFIALGEKRLSAGARQLPPYAIPDHADRDELRLLQRYFRIIPLFGYHTPEITTGLLDEKLDSITSKLAAWPVDELKTYREAGNMAGVTLRSAAFMKGADWLEVNDEGLVILLESLIASGQKPLARAIATESLLAFMR